MTAMLRSVSICNRTETARAPLTGPLHPGNCLVGAQIGIPGPVHDGGWQRRRRPAGAAIPSRLPRGQPVPYELLVQRRLAAARPPLAGRPEPGRVGREHLVGEPERALGVAADLDLR